MPLPYNTAQYIYQQAPSYGVDPNLALGIANAESGSANGALNGNPDSGGMSFGPFQLFFSSGNPLGNNSPSVGTGFVNTYGVAPNASNWQQQVDYSLQTMASPGGLRNWPTYNNQGSSSLSASGQNIASSMGLSSSGSATSGSSLGINPDGSASNYGDITGYSVAGVNAPMPGNNPTPDLSDLPDDTFDSDAPVAALGNNQGTPSLGGAFGGTASATGQTGTPLPGQQNTGEASVAGQSVQTGLGTAGTDVENASGGITGTLASAINSLETYTSSAFVIIALVVLGLILVAYGLGLFGKRELAIAGL